MNILSLFDGMSCGHIALERAGIKVDKYFASEIKKTAIKVTQDNYPDTIQISDVTKVKYEDGILYWNGGQEEIKIDMIIGGSPCQDLSIANRKREGLEGSKSGLFYEYVRLLKEVKPKYRLLENVKMDNKNYEIISRTMGCYPVNINSSLVSAQLRNRFYRTNIGPRNYDLFGFPTCAIPQPKDRKIHLKDIIENGVVDREKSRAILEGDSRPHSNENLLYRRYKETGFGTIVYLTQEEIKKAKESRKGKEFDSGKKNGNMVLDRCEIGKSICLTASDFGPTSRQGNLVKDNIGIRVLTQLELERLQTVPEGYTKCLTRNQAAGVLGDGWTVDVIAYIFSFLK